MFIGDDRPGARGPDPPRSIPGTADRASAAVRGYHDDTPRRRPGDRADEDPRATRRHRRPDARAATGDTTMTGVHRPARRRYARELSSAAALLALSPAGAARAQGGPKRGGSLSISLETDVPGLDPLLFSSYNDKQAGLCVYDTLLDVDARGTLLPNLVERWEAAPDATWYKLELRAGVKFHDETPCDAQAVVAHFNRLMDPKLRYRWAADLAPIASLEASGPLEVTLRMKAPSAHFLAVLADTSGMVVSPTAAQRLGESFRENPVGTGPFVLKEWRRGSQIVFARNSAYWRGPVHLDEVVLRPMPDEQTRIASLKAGNLDIVMNAPAKDVIEARSSKKLTVLDPGSLGTTFVMINVTTPDVSDRRVRLAMTHALDRDALNKVVNRGLLKVANTPFGSGLAPHEQVTGFPKFDLARARALLAEYGKPVKLKFMVTNMPQSLLSAQAIQAMWKKAGIEAEIQPVEQVQAIRLAGQRQFQVALWRWQGGLDPDRNVHVFFHSKGTANRTGFSTPELDALLDAGRRTADPAERLKIYRQVNDLLARELPHLFLTYFNNFSLASPAVKGVLAVPDGLIRVRDVWKERA
jgi:ABC-type transport system substrate-binding protein